jgi:hypothetical protein
MVAQRHRTLIPCAQVMPSDREGRRILLARDIFMVIMLVFDGFVL